MPAPAANRRMSVEEIEAYIRQVAAEMGIDPETAVQVAKSEGLQEGTWQSDASYKGGREQSYGPYQLFTGGGKGNEFEAQYGPLSQDPSNIKQQVQFALSEAAKGGWGPWHGAKRAGIGSRQGLPAKGYPQAVGRRGRAGELAAMQPQIPQAPQPPQKTSGLMDMFKEYQDRVDPRGPQTLGAWVGDRLGANDPNARQSERTHSILGLLANKISPPTEKEQIAQDAEGYNEFAPMGRAAQLEALKKRKNLGSGVMGMFGFG